MKKAKKNLLKTCLIVLAVLLAVGAVLIFLKTRVQPPRKIAYVNQYTENIHQASERIARADAQGLEQDFQLVINRIELLKREGLISAEESAGSLSEFVNAYVPAFRNWCEQRFNQSVWPEKSLQFMQRRIDEVKRINVANSENVAKLNEVDKILKDYRAAWKLQKVAVHSSGDARSNLAKANQFKQDAHLSKCTALVNMLNGLPSLYQRRHSNYVLSLVSSLDMSHYTSENQIGEWATKYKKAKSAVNDYNSVASSLYNTSSNEFNLNDYYRQAKLGFRSKIDSWSDHRVREEYEQTFGVRIS